MATLELTPASERVIKDWSDEKSRAAKAAINTWLQRVGVWGTRQATDAFAQQKQPGGPAWAPNESRYAAWKAERGQTSVGVVTGTLRQSINSHVHGKSVHIGTGLNYAPYFHYGTSRGIPSRKITPTKESTRKHAMNLLDELIKSKVVS